MSENMLPFLARDAALAYANSPASNKNDPRAFAEAVRNVYDSVLAVKVAKSVETYARPPLDMDKYRAPLEINSVWRPGTGGRWFKSTNGGPFLLDPEYGEKS